MIGFMPYLQLLAAIHYSLFKYIKGTSCIQYSIYVYSCELDHNAPAPIMTFSVVVKTIITSHRILSNALRQRSLCKMHRFAGKMLKHRVLCKPLGIHCLVSLGVSAVLRILARYFSRLKDYKQVGKREEANAARAPL